MHVDNSRKFGPFNGKELSAGVAIFVCFVMLVTSIVSFRGGTAAYNSFVAYKVLLWLAALASVAFMFGRAGRPPRIETMIAFGGLAGVFTAAALNSPASQVSLLRLSMYYSLVAFGFVLSNVVSRPSRSTVARLLLAIAMAHAPILAIALYAASVHDPSLPFTPPFFGNVRHLGYLGFIGAAASLAFLILDVRLRAAGMFLTVYALFGVLALGSRGPVISWVLSAAVLALVSSQRNKVLWVAAGCLGSAVALAYLADSIDIFKVVGIFDRSALTDGIATVSVGRPAVWLESWRHITAQPFLGYGPEGFAIAGVTRGMFIQPHNLVLQILLESGLLGLAATLAFGWALFARRLKALFLSWRTGTLDDEEAGLVAILAGFFAFGLIDGVFYHVIPLLCFVIILSTWTAIRAPAGISFADEERLVEKL